MTIIAAVGICIVLLIVSFIAPSLSRHPERGVMRVLSVPRRLVSKLPGPIGRWAAKPFSNTQKYAGKSARKGREMRSKTPV